MVVTRCIEFTVAGIPRTKGDKTPGRRNNGTLFVRERNATNVTEWIRKVRAEAKKHRSTFILQSPLEVRLLFVTKHPPKGRMSGEWCATSPDADKLARCVLDALKNTVMVDDAQVVRLLIETRYGDELGVRITVRDAPPLYPTGVD